MSEFKLLKQAISDELSKRYKNISINTEEELNKELMFYNKSYKGDFEQKKTKFKKWLNSKFEKEHAEKMNFIKSIEDSPSFPNPLIITVEWKKSRMWGNNPKAYTNYGFNGESIGGCGYCKLSTATAQALNSCKPILKLLYKKEERRLKENPQPERRAYIGYGSGYGVLPSFEGGVGVESHKSIIEGMGLKWENTTSTSQTDVYRIWIN